MNRRVRLGRGTLPLVLGLGLVGCASGAMLPASPANPDLLTAGELSGAAESSVYEAVQRLRPGFLWSRGRTSLLLPDGAGPAVWMDGHLMGGVEWLQWLVPRDVVSIRRLSAWDAATAYGARFPEGVLLVTTRRGR